MTLNNLKSLFYLFVLIVIFSCTKSSTLIEGNDSPYYDEIPTIQIENYVNRLFIDLLGREALDVELSLEVNLLRQADLAESARKTLITKLQTDDTFIQGDSSYHKAYTQNLYDLCKVRTLEGAADSKVISERGMAFNRALRDSIEGDWTGYEENLRSAEKLQLVLDARADLEAGEIFLNDMLGRMINNKVYDIINMNSFNFVNATFDNLLWRFPSSSEFDAGYNMVEYNISATLFNVSGTTKDDYVDIIANSFEIYEGMIIWAYQLLIARNPTTSETSQILNDFIIHKNIDLIIQDILLTDEYANF